MKKRLILYFLLMLSIGSVFTQDVSYTYDNAGNRIKRGVNVSQYNWQRTVNSWKIDMGMFKGNFGQVLNKLTYGLVNSIVGNYVAEVYNFIGYIDDVSDLDGMLALSGATNGTAAFTIGHYSFGPDNYTADWRDHLFVHEYGHYIQSQFLGSGYLMVIAKPSLTSAAFTSQWSGVKHSERWFEVSASKLGANYFDRHYGRGNKNYIKKDARFFDISSFYDAKVVSPYNNPRDGKFNYGDSNPTHSKIAIFDFVF